MREQLLRVVVGVAISTLSHRAHNMQSAKTSASHNNLFCGWNPKAESFLMAAPLASWNASMPRPAGTQKLRQGVDSALAQISDRPDDDMSSGDDRSDSSESSESSGTTEYFSDDCEAA